MHHFKFILILTILIISYLRLIKWSTILAYCMKYDDYQNVTALNALLRPSSPVVRVDEADPRLLSS